MANLYWMSDGDWSRIEPHLPRGGRGAHRVDDGRVISGIVHMLRSGARWRDCPAEYGPYTTIYNRFNRWSRQGVWQEMFEALTGETGHALTDAEGRPRVLLLTPGNVADITVAPAPIAAAGPIERLVADEGYDANSLRTLLADNGNKAVIPSTQSRKAPIPYDTSTYRERKFIDRVFGRIKDFRRIATRYDKLDRNFLAALALAAIVIWWLD